VGNAPYRFELIECDGEIVGYCSAKPNVWVKEPGLFWITLMLLPDAQEQGIETEALGRMESEALRLGATKVAIRVRSDCPALIDATNHAGYTCVQRDLITRLDLAEFEMTRHVADIEKLTQHGIDIVSIFDLLQAGEGWLPEAYELNSALLADVELVGGFQKRPYEDFRADVLNPEECDPKVNLYARSNGKLVGETGLFPIQNAKHICLTGLTGVLPAFRRKGIATALKVRSLQAAKEAGAQVVYTGNERNNPMYRVNLGLGYRDDYEDCSYTKTL
jgi:GNAT superfamily N-acetyltransferase